MEISLAEVENCNQCTPRVVWQALNHGSGTGGQPGNSLRKALPMYPRYLIPISLVKKPSAVMLRRNEKNATPWLREGSTIALRRYAILSRISFCCSGEQSR